MALALATTIAAPAWPATLMVTAIVRAKASLNLQGVPSQLLITREDVRRGFVDAPSPMVLSVSSTGPRRLALLFSVANQHIRHATMDGLGGPSVPMSADGVSLPAPQGHRSPLWLRFRFYLEPDTPPGAYPWPVQVAASA